MGRFVAAIQLVAVGALVAGLGIGAGESAIGKEGAKGASGKEVKAIKALLVTGGCCHDYKTQTKILTEGISARVKVNWTVVHEGGTNRNHKVSIYQDAKWAEKYDVVVHNECFGGVKDVKLVERIAAGHKAGVGGVVLHCSAHSYRGAKTDEWRKTVGVSSYRHERHRAVEVKNLKADHPIMKGFGTSWKTPAGELYVIQKLWPGAVPLGSAYGKDTKKDHVCIWTNRYGKGKVFGTTIGHHNETMKTKVYLDMVARGLLWACGKLGKDGEAKAGYGVRRK